MISALTGELRRIETDRAHMVAGPLTYEVLISAADVDELRRVCRKHSPCTRFFILAVIQTEADWNRR